MRHGFTLGIAMLYIMFLFLQMFLTGQASMDDTNNLGDILDGYNPETRENDGIFPGGFGTYTNSESGQSELQISDFWRITTALGNMSMLYHPALFTGNYIYIWYIFCLPIALVFWLSMGLALFRGVSSG